MVLILAMLTAACSGDATDSGAAESTDQAEEAKTRIGVKREIRLALTDWTGSRINAAIAESLIERRFGYPVSLVPIEGDTASMLGRLERGELDAVLELWPSSLSDREQAMIDDGRVDDLGPLGVIGRIGWYVPSYVIDEDPALAGWEGYRDRSVARRFATAATEPDGRFLGTDPGYDQFDEELIEALGLPFEVVYSGSEDETRRELDRATSAREPILVYWWSPTAEIADYDLVKVELPARTDDCLRDRADGGLMACDYPEDQLLKLASPQLAETDPELHGFLRRFRLATEEQIDLITRAESNQEPIAAIAGAWIDDNQDVWETWVEQDE